MTATAALEELDLDVLQEQVVKHASTSRLSMARMSTPRGDKEVQGLTPARPGPLYPLPAGTPRRASGTPKDPRLPDGPVSPSRRATALEPKTPKARVKPISAALRDQAAWAANTHAHLKVVRALRGQLQRQVRPGCAEICAHQVTQDTHVGGSLGSGATAAEDRLKRRQAESRNLLNALQDRMESTERVIFQVLQSASGLQRAGGALLAALGVAEKRIELRAGRPEGEQLKDQFQEALEAERDALVEARRALANQAEAGQEALAPLLEARAEMQQGRLTMHLDRSGQASDFLENVRNLEANALRFCTATNEALSAAARAAERTGARTTQCMRQRVAETMELRRQLEREIKETHTVVTQAERRLERMQRLLRDRRGTPEPRAESPAPMVDTLSSSAKEDRPPSNPPATPRGKGAAPTPVPAAAAMSPTPTLASLTGSSRRPGLAHSSTNLTTAPPSPWTGKLAALRSKVRAAAYAGHAGRQLGALFQRHDRGGAGALDEDEVRATLRRTLKVPTSVVSDAEISLICSMLDTDRSGSVPIPELVEFLGADFDCAALEAQISAAGVTLLRLKNAQDQLMEDLRAKTAAWRIDDACTRVTPIKGLELDNVPPSKSPEDAAPKRRVLKAEAMEAYRSRIRSAASTAGRPLDVVLSRFDKEGSGRLGEEALRKALRRSLRIPPTALTDAELSALFAALDADNAGSVGIPEFVDFVLLTDSTNRGWRTPSPGAGAGRMRLGEELQSEVGIAGLDSTTPRRSPTPSCTCTSPLPSATPRRRRPRKPLGADFIEGVRAKLKAAAYSGMAGRPLDVVFGRLDKEGSGMLDDDGIRCALRRMLRIPPQVLSDQEISSLCALLDVDNSGAVYIDEIIRFIGLDSQHSKRPSIRMPRVASEKAADGSDFDCNQNG